MYNHYKQKNICTCNPSMANRSILGVNLEACLKVKLLQSIIKINPFTCSSGSSIIASNDSRMARKISINVYLKMETQLIIFVHQLVCQANIQIANMQNSQYAVESVI